MTHRTRRQRTPPVYRDEPTYTEANLNDVDRIQTQEWLAEDARRKGDAAQRQRHLHAAADIRERLAADIVNRQDDGWADAALRETARLEQLRGEAVDLEQQNGKVRRLRIRTRDGLLAIFPCRELNEEARRQSQILLKAGMEYRTLYEAAQQELPSSLPKGPGRGANGNPAAYAAYRARVAIEVARLEAAVEADQVNGRGITALRRIAGRGDNLNQLARGGANKDLYSKALKRALGVVVRQLNIERVQPAVFRG